MLRRIAPARRPRTLQELRAAHVSAGDAHGTAVPRLSWLLERWPTTPFWLLAAAAVLMSISLFWVDSLDGGEDGRGDGSAARGNGGSDAGGESEPADFALDVGWFVGLPLIGGMVCSGLVCEGRPLIVRAEATGIEDTA